MTPWCGHCGSRNHASFDCAKQGQTYTPTAEEMAELAPVAAVEVAEPEPEGIFEPGRFKGCPDICTKANLPAFPDEAGARKWTGSFDGFKVLRVWLCQHCNQWHVLSQPRGPAGASSGNEREITRAPWELVGRTKAFIRRDFETTMMRVHQHGYGGDLPQQEAAPMPEPSATPVPAKKKLEAKRVIPQTGKRDGDLF